MAEHDDPENIRSALLDGVTSQLAGEIEGSAAEGVLRLLNCSPESISHAKQQVSHALAWLMSEALVKDDSKRNKPEEELAALAEQCLEGNFADLRGTYLKDLNPTDLNPRQSSRLAELAWSVASEMRNDWHTEPSRIAGHLAKINAVSFSMDGKRVLSASDDRTVRLSCAVSGSSSPPLRVHDGRVLSASLSPDGRHVVTASHRGFVRIRNTESEAIVHELGSPKHEAIEVCFTPDGGSVIAACRDGSVAVWDPGTGKDPSRVSGTSGGVCTASFSPTCDCAVTMNQDGLTVSWDFSSGTLPRPGRGFTDSAASTRAVFIAPGGQWIVTVRDDGTAWIRLAASGKQVHPLEGHGRPIIAGSFSHDGTRIVTASEDGTARVWDAATGAPLHVLEGPVGRVTSASFSSDGKMVVTGSDVGTVTVWTVDDARVVQRFAGLDTHAVFDAMYNKESSSVRESVRKFDRDLDPGELATDAWAIAWEKYWSPDARDRFAGLSKVSTLIAGIGKNVARRRVQQKKGVG